MILLTDEDRRTLTAPRVDIDFGCDVLNDAGQPVPGVTLNDGSLLGGSITHDSTRAVHRYCDLQITRELDWGSVWLRPWQSVTAYGHAVVAHLGVFRATTPELPMGSEPRIWRVQGADRLSPLQDIIGDSRVSPAGVKIGDEIRDAITYAQVPGQILGSGDVGNIVLDRPRVWLFDASQPASHLRRINDLLAAGGCQDLFMDGDGNFRLEKNQPLATRAAGWTFDVTDPRGIVRVDRSSSSDTWSTVNWWRFLVRDRTSAPVEGVTQYTVDRSDGGRKVRKVVETDAADYASLVAAGDQQIETETARTQTVQIVVSGFPVLEHRDAIDYKDPQFRGGVLQRTVCRGWTVDLAAGTNTITLEIPNG